MNSVIEILIEGLNRDYKVKISRFGTFKVLKKLGFTEVGKDLIFSIARNEKISHTKVELIKT